MKLPFLLCLSGAFVGGFPGGVVAFLIAASFAGTGIGSTVAEAICLFVNMLLSVDGAFLGMLLVKAIRGQERFQSVEIILPLVLGLLCGISGYMVIDWVISHAEPPL